MLRKIFIASLLLVSLGLYGQKTLIPSVSNYHLTWTTLNPAFTGYRDAASLSTLYRSGLYGGTGPVDMQLNGHTPVGNSKVGLGAVVAYNTSPPDDGMYALMTTYAYRIYLGTGRLSFGMSAGLYGVRSDINGLIIKNPGDASFPEEVYSRWFPNFGAGVLYYTEKLYLGLSVPELLAVPGPGQSLGANMEDYRVIAIGAYRFDLGSNFQLKPSLMVDYTRASIGFKASLNLGMLQNRLFIGAAYDHPNYIIALLNFKLNAKWLVGYAYTMGTGAVRSALGGSHEVVLRWELRPTIRTIENDPFYF